MKIVVTSGLGEGNTTLSAFDSALKDAGIHNYNLIKLSSVIPPSSKIILEKWKNLPSEHGKKLYVVIAEERTDQLGHSIAAGVGWYQVQDGRGVFIEHHDIVESPNTKEAEENVAQKIESSIKDLCMHRDWTFSKTKLHMKISSAEVKNKPTCTLVAAIYESQDFDKA